MPVIAVINRKGGSGKSTLATHLAAWCAHAGIPVMLGDVDRQQSTQSWLRLREAQGLAQKAQLVGWAVDPKRVMRPPAGVNHVILDTPGGLHGFDLARVAMCADAILMPVCNSVFDRQSSAECHAELMALPRIASGRCKVAAVGMRLDGRTRAAEMLTAWAADRGIPFIGALREAQAYVKCVEQGLTIFDLPMAQAQADRAQWQSILEWLEPVLHAAPRAVAREGETRRVIDAIAARAATLPAQAPTPTVPANTEVVVASGAAGTAPDAATRLTSLSPGTIAVSAEPPAMAQPARGAARAAEPISTAALLRIATPLPEEKASPRRAGPASTFGPAAPAPRTLRSALFGWLPLPRFLQRHA
jgi:chromosome partitioning protein